MERPRYRFLRARFLTFLTAVLASWSLFTDWAWAAEAAPKLDTGDTAWVLVSAALVMLMTPALGLFYGGMVRRKNVLSTVMLSFVVLALGSIQWVLIGYSLAFGPDIAGIIGNFAWAGFAGIGQAPNADYAATVPHHAFAMFQAMFAIIATALITGCFVDRIKFSAFLVFAFLWMTFIYDPIAHWVWAAGGWLANLGALDFAGGTVIHVSAGMSALALAMVIGKRKGYGEQTMEPHNVPMTVLGAALLWFGWFGFNAGSAIASNGLASSAFLATNTAAAAGGLAWMSLAWIHRRPSVLGMVTGAVAGLVAITPAAGFVGPLAAIAIGIGAGVLCYSAVLLRMRTSLDESLDVWGVHGVGGTWGAIATGIFATTAINPDGANGLLYGDSSQLVVQIVAVVVVAVFSFAGTWILAKAIDAVLGLRVSAKEEVVGLDVSQHGEIAYS